MKHPQRLLAASLGLFVGCSDFTPVETARLSGGDAAVGGTFNGCTPEMFVDRSADGAERIIGFGGERGSGGFSFLPKCMTIAAGQDVTWVGAFATHPLTRGVPGDLNGGAPANPIPTTMTGTTVTVNFRRPGTYPFVCGMHAFLGMNGAILVR